MFTFEQIEQEQVQAQARLIEATNKRTRLEDTVVNLWEEVEYLEEVSTCYNLDNYKFNIRINKAYQDYEEALKQEHDLDNEIEDLEEKIDLLKALKRYYK